MAPLVFRGRKGAGSLQPVAGCRCRRCGRRLDEESAGSSWLLHPDGVLGRALLLPAGATFTVPLKLSGEASFSGRAMLLPHDWRDGRGAVRASVAVTDAAGREQEIWSGTLRASDRGRPRGLHVDCRLPALTTGLRLSVRTVGALRYTSVARAIWLEPVIIDPSRARSGASAAGPPATRSRTASRLATRR